MAAHSPKVFRPTVLSITLLCAVSIGVAPGRGVASAAAPPGPGG